MIVRGGMSGFGDGEDGGWGADDVIGIANSSGANSVISGIFSLFGGKTSSGKTNAGAGYTPPAASAISPWVYVAGAVGVVGLGYALLKR